MDLHVLLWILGGGFAGTWGLCIFFMNRTDHAISEIRKEVSELYHCAKDHHARISILEEKNKKQRTDMENKNWFVHIEWVVVLVTLLGGFYLLDGKIERQGQRTDRLYEMWCETQKEIKQIYIDKYKS